MKRKMFKGVRVLWILTLSICLILTLAACNGNNTQGENSSQSDTSTSAPPSDISEPSSSENGGDTSGDTTDNAGDSSAILIDPEANQEIAQLAVRYIEDVKAANYRDIQEMLYIPSDLAEKDTLGLATIDGTVIGDYIKDSVYSELTQYNYKDIRIKGTTGGELSKTAIVSLGEQQELGISFINDVSNTWKLVLDGVIVKDYSVVIPLDTPLTLNETILDSALANPSATSTKVIYTFPYMSYKQLQFKYNSGIYGEVELGVKPSSSNNKSNPLKLYYELNDNQSAEVLSCIQDSWNGIVADLTGNTSADISKYFDTTAYSSEGIANIASSMISSFGNNATEVEMVDIKKRDDNIAKDASNLIFLTGNNQVLVNYTCKVKFTRDGEELTTSYPAWINLTNTPNGWKIAANSESAFIRYLNPNDTSW